MRIPKALSPGEEAFYLHCRVENLDPEREFRFHEERKWRFDFAFPRQKLAIEVEGRGRHQSFGGFDKDCEKYAEAVILGWRVIRVTPTQVMSGQAMDWVIRALKGALR